MASNQFISGGLILMLSGAALAAARHIPGKTWAWLNYRERAADPAGDHRPRLLFNRRGWAMMRTMKGPHERLKYDLRRLWECPLCKRRERTSGSVTFRHCLCQMKQADGRPVVMKLLEDGVQRLAAPIVVPPEPGPPPSAPPAPASEPAPNGPD